MSDGTDGQEGVDWATVRAQFDLAPGCVHFSQFFLASHPLPVREAIEKYSIAMVDENGNQLVGRTSSQGTDPGLSYDLALDPPGHGLYLRATSYRITSDLAHNFLVWAVVALSVLIIAHPAGVSDVGTSTPHDVVVVTTRPGATRTASVPGKHLRA